MESFYPVKHKFCCKTELILKDSKINPPFLVEGLLARPGSHSPTVVESEGGDTPWLVLLSGMFPVRVIACHTRVLT